ncbi:MAG: hypothetical protein AAGI24_07195 [Pseudomonadota bacterium]
MLEPLFFYETTPIVINNYLRDVGMKQALSIAAGIAIAALLIRIIDIAYFEYTLHRIVDTVNEFTGQLLAENEQRKKEAEQQLLQAKRAQALKAREAALHEAARQKRERAKQQYIQEADAAFNAEYVAPQGCDRPMGEAMLIQCTDHRGRAKRQFLKTYEEIEWVPIEVK